MTTYIVTRFQDDPDDGTCSVVSGDQLDTMLAEFRTDPGLPDGAGLLFRKSDYLEPVESLADFINAAETKEERRARKARVFTSMYGPNPARDALLTRHAGTVTGRMTVHTPAPHHLRVVNNALVQAGQGAPESI